MVAYEYQINVTAVNRLTFRFFVIEYDAAGWHAVADATDHAVTLERACEIQFGLILLMHFDRISLADQQRSWKAIVTDLSSRCDLANHHLFRVYTGREHRQSHYC